MANISKEERARREAEADATKTTGMDGRTENPRVPVEPVSEDALPMTPATGAFPVGTPGHSTPDDPAELAREIADAHSRVEMREVVILRGYQPGTGGFEHVSGDVGPGGMLKEGAVVKMRVEDARFLEESGIAQSTDTHPGFKDKK